MRAEKDSGHRSDQNSENLISWDTSKSKLNPVLNIGRCLDSD